MPQLAHADPKLVAPAVTRLIASLRDQPILVDVGASAEAPGVWTAFARHCSYVGFDPDLREMRRENGGCFREAFVLNEAVTTGWESRDGPGAESAAKMNGSGAVTFRLTRAPQCSSTLRPNRAVLDNYLRSECFDVLGEVSVPATTIGDAIARLGLTRVDWLKLDSQGTDLRLVRSLPEDVQARLLAVDAEPGLRGAYEGEDLFGDLHAAMLEKGFWLAGATVKGLPRVRPTTLPALLGKESALLIAATLPRCPGWVECRYLRTAEAMAGDDRLGRREHLLLWAFALAAGQPGFAGDIAVQYQHRFGKGAEAEAMASATARILKTAARQYRRCQNGDWTSRLLRRVRRLVKR